jgi:acyl-CoA synthetase (NDP forming)
VRVVIDKSIATILAKARADGRDVLLDPEGFALLEAMGIPVPRHIFLRSSEEVQSTRLASFPGDRVVVKVATSRILHKTDLGGVLTVPKEYPVVTAAVQTMERKFAQHDVAGFTLNEYIPHDRMLGGQLLLGMRWTDDFGPIVTLGPGGIYAEFLSENLRPGSGVAIFSPGVNTDGGMETVFASKAVTRLVTRHVRGKEARLSSEKLSEFVHKFLDFAKMSMPHQVPEFEINPLALTEHGPIALDVLLKLGHGRAPERSRRPTQKIRNLLEPQSIALIGASQSHNPGRMILQNILREGFNRERIYLVKPGHEELDGVQCFPSITALPETVDLFVVSVAAARLPEIVQEVIGSQKAESLIVIPGGIGEREGTEDLEEGMRFALREARKSTWQGPVVNGGNCLGIRSAPGRYDTTFLPHHKIWGDKVVEAPLAVIAQSGAFAAARSSKLAPINPRYLITVGNQSDLTVGDYLTYLKDDQDVEVFACYIEGFRPLDGQQWLTAASEIAESGRTVVLYRAGRTDPGASATATHTASIAGDYSVTRELAEAVGVVVAESLADFDDLTRMFCYLRNSTVHGWRLGAVSNAGFECVAIADSLSRFFLPSLTSATTTRLQEIFGECNIDTIVDVRNPVDLTPLMGDSMYEEAVTAIMTDANVEVGIVGCVPMTGALNTLAPTEEHGEDVFDAMSIANGLARLKQVTSKAWVAVIDGGLLYDPMAAILEDNEIPVFRTADRALRILEKYCNSRLRAMGSLHPTIEMPGH